MALCTKKNYVLIKKRRQEEGLKSIETFRQNKRSSRITLGDVSVNGITSDTEPMEGRAEGEEHLGQCPGEKMIEFKVGAARSGWEENLLRQ